jgi:hypothetical protein
MQKISITTAHSIAIPSIYLPDSNGVRREYPAQGRDDLIKQMIDDEEKILELPVIRQTPP